MEKANCHYLSKSNQKFAARNKQRIISWYNQGMTDTQIANKLGVKVEFLRNIAVHTPEIAKIRQIYIDSIGQRTRELKPTDMLIISLTTYQMNDGRKFLVILDITRQHKDE